MEGRGGKERGRERKEERREREREEKRREGNGRGRGRIGSCHMVYHHFCIIILHISAVKHLPPP